MGFEIMVDLVVPRLHDRALGRCKKRPVLGPPAIGARRIKALELAQGKVEYFINGLEQYDTRVEPDSSKSSDKMKRHVVLDVSERLFTPVSVPAARRRGGSVSVDHEDLKSVAGESVEPLDACINNVRHRLARFALPEHED